MNTATLLAAAALMASTGTYHAPRTPDGQPDLQGYWTNLSLTSLERDDGTFKSLAAGDAEADAYERMMNDPAAMTAYFNAQRKKAGRTPPPDVGTIESEWFEHLRLMRVDGERRTSFITDPADGQLPYTKEAAARNRTASRRFARTFDNPEDRDVWERCVMTTGGGPPLGNTFYNANYVIAQTKTEVVIVVEMNHDVRRIRLGGAHGPPALSGWMGDSVGAWQGDTLRVETTGFPPAYAQGVGLDFLLSPDAKVTEWFTRTGPDAIRYRFQVDDPATYTRPWRGEMVLRPGKGLQEYACHEGNYGMRGILAGARAWERPGKPLEALDGGDPPAPPAEGAAVKP
jgi:hypothetical protein